MRIWEGLFKLVELTLNYCVTSRMTFQLSYINKIQSNFQIPQHERCSVSSNFVKSYYTHTNCNHNTADFQGSHPTAPTLKLDCLLAHLDTQHTPRSIITLRATELNCIFVSFPFDSGVSKLLMER